MKRALGRLILLAALIYLGCVAAILAFIEWRDPPTALPGDATIVVLGAGQRADGTLGPNSLARLDTGLAIYRQGTAHRIVFTGGHLRHEARAIGDLMAQAARTAGIPDHAIIIEDAALSTLQNALFTADLLGPAANGPLILVTNRFHLPRAWASFCWAGMHDLTLYPADSRDSHWRQFGLKTVLQEAAKTPLNALRALGASAVGLLGLPRDSYIRLLD